MIMWGTGRFDNWKPRMSSIILEHLSLKSGGSIAPSGSLTSAPKKPKGVYTAGPEEGGEEREGSVVTMPSVLMYPEEEGEEEEEEERSDHE